MTKTSPKKSAKKNIKRTPSKSKNCKNTKVDFNIVLDLDNTLISSLTKEEYEKRKTNKNVKFIPICDGMYYTIARPYLDEFLTFIFKHFQVSVWTAATKDYAIEILKNFIIKGKKERKLKSFLYDYHCEDSIENVNPNTPKDLRYLYLSKNKKFNPNNTIIIDDHKDVIKNNKNNVVDSKYFDANKKNPLQDKFLLNLIRDLKLVHKTLCDKNN
jgi:TFIIF-interacting CTD phosphatase-like protein